MTQELMKRPAPAAEVIGTAAQGGMVIPATVADAGDEAIDRFIEFFTARIRNPNTRTAYYQADCQFFAWCHSKRLTLPKIRPLHVAAYIEELGMKKEDGGSGLSKPSVKQHLAAVRMLFDDFVIGQVVPMNPASAVRGPSYSMKKGKTAVLTEDEAKLLFKSIDTSSIVGLRDRALIAVMVYSFARVSAVVEMDVKDYYPQGKRWWFRLHEKNGKLHEMPAHHKAEEYMDAYLDATKLWDAKNWPLFRTAAGKTGALTATRMNRTDVYRMIQRRARDAGIETKIGCHSFRATGITNYLEHDGTLEKAQAMANHESARTTKLYDRRDDKLSLDEVEKISI